MVGAVEDDLAQQFAEHRGLLRRHQARDDDVLRQGDDRGVVDAVEDVFETGRRPVDDEVAVGGFAQPFACPPGDADGADLRRHRLGVKEVRRDERGEAGTEGVLLAGDDRGVRDRQAEGVAEEGGDGEPVGDRPDHRGLGAAGDEAPHAAEVGEEVRGEEDQGGEDEQGERERAHPLQPPRPLLVLGREFARPAEARHGCLRRNRHSYPLGTDSSEPRPALDADRLGRGWEPRLPAPSSRSRERRTRAL